MTITGRHVIAVLILLLTLLTSCTTDNQGTKKEQPQKPVDNTADTDDITATLNSTFRIDIDSISVEFDYTPEQYHVKGRATVKFVMREGQTRPLIHFNPGTRDINSVKLVRLNGEDLNKQSDIVIKSFDNTDQKALEFQRDLAAGATHTLYMEYELEIKNRQNYIFITDVHDIRGTGNEELFPTINSPQDLISHEIRFRNLGSVDLKMIGSGNVTEEKSSARQEWILKPVRPVASYTLMFALAIADDIDYHEKTISGVNVRMMAYKNTNLFTTAVQYLEECLPQFIGWFGDFPMPEGLSLFLTAGAGGMEYYGGSITSLGALKHEVFHMYFACSVVNRTYRDSWLDEAITSWNDSFLENYDLGTLSESFRSNIVSGRSPVQIGFNTKAYYDGAKIIGEMARKFGNDREQSRNEMLKFLKYLYDNHRFKPYTTRDFVEYFKTYSGYDMKADFEKWVFSSTNSSREKEGRKADYIKIYPDTAPPQHIRLKYR